jgi:hypothetical protein
LKKANDDYDNDYDNDNDKDPEFWIFNPLIGELSISRAPVVYHGCRGGGSSGKINWFIFLDENPHRHSPMSFLILFFCFSWRLSVLARVSNPFASSQNIVSTLPKANNTSF